MIPGGENISVDEFVHLLRELWKFKRTHFMNGATKDQEYIAFLKHLKITLRKDELLSLVKIGADKVDCHIPFFEQMDANHAGATEIRSLKWLAAKAVSAAPKGVKRVLPADLEPTVEAGSYYGNAERLIKKMRHK